MFVGCDELIMAQLKDEEWLDCEVWCITNDQFFKLLDTTQVGVMGRAENFGCRIVETDYCDLVWPLASTEGVANIEPFSYNVSLRATSNPPSV